jgi:tetratricopeptide (TPR) repeat protein
MFCLRFSGLVAGVSFLALAALAGDLPKPKEKPVGIVLAANGAVFIDTHQSETSWTAAPGILLLPGYTLRNVKGSIRFSFCPNNSELSLAPGSAVTLRAAQIEGPGTLPAGHPSFCQLPVVDSPADSAARGDEPPEEPLAPQRAADLALRLKPVDAALAADPRDFSAHLARIAILQEFGRASDLQTANKALAKLAPDATWTRGVFVPPPPPSVRQDPGKIYALIVGISAYKNLPPEPLQFADKDAELFARLLSTPGKDGRAAADDVRLLTNQQATRAAIESEVAKLAKENAAAPKKNTLVLYVAGHGAYPITDTDHKPAEQEPYILTYDAQTQDLKTTAYPMQDFRTLIAAQAAHFGRVLVFVDVCHSNQIGTVTSNLKLPDAVQEVFNGHAGEFGMMLATKTLAFESPLFGNGHGAFTYFLVDGWNGAAAPDSSKIEFEDLFDYVKQGVRRVTNQAQTPEAQDPDPNLVVATGVDQRTKIVLEPAHVLPPGATAAYRGAKTPPGKASIAAGADEIRPSGAAPRSFDEALAAGVLLAREPGSAAGFFNAARATATPQQLDDMRDRLQVALENRGQETILRYLEGNQIPQTKDDFVTGGRYFEAALELAPDSVFDEARMIFCQGRALIFDHDYAGSRALLERSIRLDPVHSYAYNALGISYLEQIATNRSTFDDAIRAFHDAARFAPYWAYPLHNLALAYEQAGDYAGAERTYLAAIPLGRQYSYLYYNLAMLYQKLNDLPQAKHYYLLAKDAAVRNPHVVQTPAGARSTELGEVWDALGTVASARNRRVEAERDYRQALSADPQSLNARHNLALLLSRASRSQEAETLWEQNLQADPNSLPSLLAYADYLTRIGSTDRALTLYRRVAGLKTEYAGVHRKVAAIWIQRKQPDKALPELRLALQSSPGNAELLEQIGNVENQLGDRAAALKDWQEAAQNSDDSAVRRRLARLMGGPRQ